MFILYIETRSAETSTYFSAFENQLFNETDFIAVVGRLTSVFPKTESGDELLKPTLSPKDEISWRKQPYPVRLSCCHADTPNQ